jgi:hypothetical protein
MKKLLIASLIGLLPTIMMAQDVAINNKLPELPATVTSSSTDAKTTKELRKAARETKQFARTTKLFARDFENASNVQWSSSNNGHTASFTKNDIKTIAWYSKGGKLQYTMLTYGADKLPAAEQEVIKSEYGDYDITLVNEVHQDDITVYVVHLENKHNFKQVTVCNGATNIYRAYRKM